MHIGCYINGNHGDDIENRLVLMCAKWNQTLARCFSLSGGAWKMLPAGKNERKMKDRDREQNEQKAPTTAAAI